MDENPFENNELCDGKCCVIRAECARYIESVDIEQCNPYVIFNRKPWPVVCPYFISRPNDKYPEIELHIKP